ncbi:igLON family member 5-like [Tigriopus californicus]|uniref:igLON family member 5-like n=1 Tax=Tigriopus californicus TaxID=6832 RepID=UPI0027DA7538|nr:igLON family member 5-like [Tigriopus californicus]
MNGLIVLFLTSVALTQGLPTKTESYYQYYADDYDYSSDDDYLNENEQVVHTIPQFTSTSSEMLINEGDTIKLPCFVDELDGYVLMWKKKNDIISLGGQMMKKDARIQLVEGKNGNTLVISLAEVEDEGEYQCQLSANQLMEIRHNVKIRVKPMIRPNPTNGLVVVYEGEPATLGCEILKGSPMPDLIWTRKERKFSSGEDELRGLEITFPRATRHHSGVYICQANNGFSKIPATATVRLDVQHAPSVEQEQTFIHTRENDETEVVCIVHASPKAKVEWFKNGQLLKLGEGIVSHRNNRHTLLLPGITQSTFGTYSCRATNRFGSDERTTQVSGEHDDDTNALEEPFDITPGLASSASVKTSPYGEEKSGYKVEWVAESITPITAFKLQYRPVGTSSWSEDILVTPTSNGDHLYSGKYKFQKLQLSAHYEVRISSKNEYGFNDWSEEFAFGTKGADLPSLDKRMELSNDFPNDLAPLQQPSTGHAHKQAVTLLGSQILAFVISAHLVIARVFHH